MKELRVLNPKVKESKLGIAESNNNTYYCDYGIPNPCDCISLTAY